MLRASILLIVFIFLSCSCVLSKKKYLIESTDINISRETIKDDVITYVKNDYIRSGYECDLEFLSVEMLNADTCVVRMYETNCKVTHKTKTSPTYFSDKEEILMTIDLKNNKIVYAERIPAL